MRFPRLTAAVCVNVILLCAVSVQAQSGRRQTKPPPAAPVPTPTPEPTPTPKKDQKEPEMIFLVGHDRKGSFSLPFTFYDAVMQGCSERLKARLTADVDVARQELGRGDAIKKAKSETRTYVVLLSLVFDHLARSYDDLMVEYVVFAPGTAKVVTTGRSYMNSNRAGPIVVSPPTRGPGGLYREELIRQAGEDAADRILKAMKLGQVVIQK